MTEQGNSSAVEWSEFSSSASQDDGTYFLFPLTPQQRKMWAFCQARPDDSRYNAAFRMELRGHIDEAAFAAAINDLVARHESLRANIVEIDGEAHFAVREHRAVHIQTIDFRSREEAAAEAGMEQFSSDEASRCFDLAEDPLVRVCVVRITNSRSVVTITMHGVVCDGWSISMLLSEFAETYRARVLDAPANLPELAIEYGDYAVWQQERLDKPDIKRQVVYWRKQLTDYHRADVPADLNAGSAAQSSRETIQDHIVTRMLPASLATALDGFTRSRSSTMFMTTLAACIALLRHETGLADVSVGTPVAGRSTIETEAIFGHLLNHIVVRAGLEGDPTLLEVEALTRAAVVEALSQQDVPLEYVASTIRDAGVDLPDPVFSVCFVCQKGFGATGRENFVCDESGIELITMPSKSPGAVHDLFFFMVERDDGWRLSLDYDPAKFSRAKADELLEDLYRLLDAIAASPAARLSEIELSGSGRRLVPANDTALVVENGSGLVERAKVADHTSNQGDCIQVAASFAQERMWLLWRAAPESSAFNMGIALAVEGPLDPKLLGDCLRELATSHEILRTTFAERDGELCQIIVPDGSPSLERRDLSGLSEPDLEQQQAAEINGTIGRPYDLEQGPLMRVSLIEIGEHRNILVLAMHHIVSDGQSFANIQRELWDLYAARKAGVAAKPSEQALQFADYAEWQRNWVNSEAAEVQRTWWQESLQGKLPVLDFPLDNAPAFGTEAQGEAYQISVPPNLDARLRKRVGDENCTMFALTAAAFAALLSRYSGQYDILFGSPMANRSGETETMIGPFSGPLALRFALSGDTSLRQVLIHVRDGLMDAFSNVELPFECIVEDLDVSGVGGRNPLFQFYFLYQKAFVGRHEIAGVRMEPLPAMALATPYELQLGLIERESGVTAQLLYNPALLDQSTVEKIAAYYLDVLSAFATEPETLLDELPKPEIKEDSYRLSQDEQKQTSFVAPRNETEKKLATIWRQLFKSEEIGVNDDFFALGGRSLLAARMIAQIAKDFDIRLNISVLAQSRTIAELGRLLDGNERSQSNLVALRTTGTNRPLFLMHCGGGHLLRYQDFVAAMPDDQPIFGLCAPPIGRELNRYTVEQLAALYITEMRKVQPHGPYKIGGYSFGGLLAYETASQLMSAGEHVSMLAIFDTGNPFYYRNLPASTKRIMRRIHTAEVARRYAANLFKGRFASAGANLAETLENRFRDVKNTVSKRVGRSAGSASADKFEDNLPIFAALTNRYVPRPYPGSILLFYSEGRGGEYRSNPSLGWEGLARGGVLIRYVPGDHYTVMQQPHVQTLVSKFVKFQEVARNS